MKTDELVLLALRDAQTDRLRTLLRGLPDTTKCLLLDLSAFNFAIVLRRNPGRGTPLGLAALAPAIVRAFLA